MGPKEKAEKSKKEESSGCINDSMPNNERSKTTFNQAQVRLPLTSYRHKFQRNNNNTGTTEEFPVSKSEKQKERQLKTNEVEGKVNNDQTQNILDTSYSENSYAENLESSNVGNDYFDVKPSKERFLEEVPKPENDKEEILFSNESEKSLVEKETTQDKLSEIIEESQYELQDGNEHLKDENLEELNQYSDINAARDLLLLKSVSKKSDENIYPLNMSNKVENTNNEYLIDKNSNNIPNAPETADARNSFQSNCNDNGAFSPYYDYNAQYNMANHHYRLDKPKSIYSAPKRPVNRFLVDNYVFSEEMSPLLTGSGSLSVIQPISSCSKKITNFRRLDISDDMIENLLEAPVSFSRQELLSELKNIASTEAKSLESYVDRYEEACFNPPMFPDKHPLQYLLEVAEADTMNQNFGYKVKRRKNFNFSNGDDTAGNDPGAFKSFNDFEEDIFAFDQATKLYNCPWAGCDKSFPSLSRIKRHYIIHTDIKPFKCLNAGCTRKFSRKDNMLQHYRVHCPYASQNKADQ